MASQNHALLLSHRQHHVDYDQEHRVVDAWQEKLRFLFQEDSRNISQKMETQKYGNGIELTMDKIINGQRTKL